MGEGRAKCPNPNSVGPVCTPMNILAIRGSLSAIVNSAKRSLSLPVMVANLIAWPIAYAYLRHWLDGYAYRIALNPLYFLAAGAVALRIAWATVYGNTVRLARISPVHSLRYE